MPSRKIPQSRRQDAPQVTLSWTFGFLCYFNEDRGLDGLLNSTSAKLLKLPRNRNAGSDLVAFSGVSVQVVMRRRTIRSFTEISSCEEQPKWRQQARKKDLGLFWRAGTVYCHVSISLALCSFHVGWRAVAKEIRFLCTKTQTKVMTASHASALWASLSWRYFFAELRLRRWC